MTRTRAIELDLHAPPVRAEVELAVFIGLLLVANAALLLGWLGIGG